MRLRQAPAWRVQRQSAGEQLEPGVGAVTEWLVGGVLAAAEINGLRLSGFKSDGREVCALVTAIAEGLLGATATSAPGIGFSSFEFNGEGTLLGNQGF